MKLKIAIVILCVAALGYGIYTFVKDKNTPQILLKEVDKAAGTVNFKMSYLGHTYEETVKLDEVKTKHFAGVSFEVVTKADKMIFSIKTPTGQVVAKKEVSFG